MFAELVNNTPFLFEYQSDTDTWQSSEAALAAGPSAPGGPDGTYLCAAHAGPDCVMVYSGPGADRPVFFRPRFPHNLGGHGDRLHVYGDGSAVVVRSTAVEARTKVVAGVELYGFGPEVGGDWQLVSTVPAELVEGFRKPYAVMTGLLAEREGVIRLILISNCRGAWDLVWLSYERRVAVGARAGLGRRQGAQYGRHHRLLHLLQALAAGAGHLPLNRTDRRLCHTCCSFLYCKVCARRRGGFLFMGDVGTATELPDDHPSGASTLSGGGRTKFLVWRYR
jgi:hypothetical protein